jgi:hypothetical protein
MGVLVISNLEYPTEYKFYSYLYIETILLIDTKLICFSYTDTYLNTFYFTKCEKLINSVSKHEFLNRIRVKKTIYS